MNLENSVWLLSPLLVLNKPANFLSSRFTNRYMYYQDSDNVYELKIFKRFPNLERQVLPKNGRVEFTRAEDAQDLELPNAALLDCHYRLAEILNASGMAELIEGYLQDWEDIKGSAGGSLREDGVSDIGQVLRVALWERVVG